jgi:oligopeptide transport system substrate-binding protein
MHLGIRFRAIALATAALFAVVACGGSSGNGLTLASTQELRVRLTTEPASFDPGQQQWDYEAAVGRQTFEALLRTTKDGKDAVGAAADSYTIDSTGTVYTFKLHKGATWSDGQPVKAADFVYGFQRLLDPRLAAPYASFYYSIKNANTVNNMDPKDPGVDAALQTIGLKAVDDNTFQVTLEAPAGYFKWVASLWTSSPVRKDIVAKYGKDSSGNDKWGAVAPAAPQTVVGNGLYKISEDVPKDHVTLVANSSYSGSQPKPTLTKITESFIDDETVAYAKYKSGELDMVTVPLADTEAVRTSPELVATPELTVFWVDINVTKAPFDNAKVRLAFAQAIDRDSFTTNIEKGRGLSATTLIPKGMRNYRPDLGTAQTFNAATAKATLASSGVSAASLNGIKYTYRSSSPGDKTAAEFVQAQLKTNLGVDIVLDGTDSKTQSKRLRTLNYQFGGLSGWGADYPDSQDWFDIFVTGSGNQFSGWSNKAYDNAVTAGDAASDNAKRDTAYETAEKTLVQEAPVLFLYQRTQWRLVKPYVKGINATPNDDQWLGDFFTWSIQIAQH